MNQTSDYSAGLAVLMVAVKGVIERPEEGLKTSWAVVPEDATFEAALARAVEQYPLSNERLLAYAARNPPPQRWYDGDEDLF
jgi:hypothetical protein